MKFTKPTKSKEIKRNWHLIDVKGKILGRVATKIAGLLIGKSKPNYAPFLDCGDYVVVINIRKVEVSGKKRKEKIYKKYSGYPGGLKEKPFERVIEENPKRIIRNAIKGMLPKNKLQSSMLKRLYMYEGEKHPFADKLKVLSH